MHAINYKGRNELLLFAALADTSDEMIPFRLTALPAKLSRGDNVVNLNVTSLETRYLIAGCDACDPCYEHDQLDLLRIVMEAPALPTGNETR
jgi:hypothetical protein